MNNRERFRKKHDIHIYDRKHNLKSKYGLSLDQFDEMVIRQNHKCAICGSILKEKKRCVDHDHKTGKIRGILCAKCNLSLGFIENKTEFVKKAGDYLSRTK